MSEPRVFLPLTAKDLAAGEGPRPAAVDARAGGGEILHAYLLPRHVNCYAPSVTFQRGPDGAWMPARLGRDGAYPVTEASCRRLLSDLGWAFLHPPQERWGRGWSLDVCRQETSLPPAAALPACAALAAELVPVRDAVRDGKIRRELEDAGIRRVRVARTAWEPPRVDVASEARRAAEEVLGQAVRLRPDLRGDRDLVGAWVVSSARVEVLLPACARAYRGDPHDFDEHLRRVVGALDPSVRWG